MIVDSEVTAKVWRPTAVKICSVMWHTDRLGAVVPGDVVVKVGVVRHAPDLQFLPNNTHVFIHLQKDIRGETELWNEMDIDAFQPPKKKKSTKLGYSAQ